MLKACFDPSNVVLESSYGQYHTPYLFGTSGSTWNYYDPFTGTLVRSIANATASASILLTVPILPMEQQRSYNLFSMEHVESCHCNIYGHALVVIIGRQELNGQRPLPESTSYIA